MRIGHASYLPIAGGILTGNLNIGAHQLKTTNLVLHQESATNWRMLDTALTSYTHLKLNWLYFKGSLQSETNATALIAKATNANYLALQARDTDVGAVEIARLVGAADPYFQATLPMVLKPSAEPSALVEGHFWYDATADQLKYKNAVGVQKLCLIDSGTYAGDDADNKAIAHSLGVKPKLVLVMSLSSGERYAGFMVGADYFQSFYGAVDAVTTPTTTNFYVPEVSDVKLNTSGSTYYWIAIA